MIKRLIILAALLVCTLGTCLAGPVKGVVSCGKEKLAGVVVTDGYRFTQTDKKGRFSLDPDFRAEFISIVTPSGYTAPYESGSPVFYRKIEPGADYRFDLIPYGNQDGYVLFAVSDPQTGNDTHFKRFEAETVADMRRHAAEHSANGRSILGLMLGDIVWDNLPLFADYKQSMAALGFPVYPVIGNHDYDQHAQGDDAAAWAYREQFGPEYYAFNSADEYFIVLDNIVYDTQKRYTEAIDQRQLDWVENYLASVPAGSHIVLCAHSPFHLNRKLIDGADELFGLLEGYRVRTLCGHTHINSNVEILPGILEHNIGACCGAWWTDDSNKDGTPNGYQVFQSAGGEFSWYYKTNGREAGYQIEAYDRGTFPNRANCVAVKAWNRDNAWKAEWYEDGVYKGEMEPFVARDPGYLRYLQARRDAGKAEVGEYKKAVERDFYFAARPSSRAREVEVVVTDRFGNTYREKIPLLSVDVQAHRGGMGLWPENTTEAMVNALALGVNSLELDLQVTRDRQVVVCHDPVLSWRYAAKPDGSPVEKDKDRFVIYEMDYDSLRRFDVGMNENPNFPGQQSFKAHIPLLSVLIDAVEAYTREHRLDPVNYNIEIKSSEKAERDGLTPGFREYADLTMQVLAAKNLGERSLVQCSDVRTLNYLHRNYPQVRLAYLISAARSDFEANMALLDFIPEGYSPNFSLVDPELIEKCSRKGMALIPWTVDDTEAMRRLIGLQVDGIITNYPDQLLKITRKY